MEEAGDEVVSQTVRNQSKYNETGQTAGSWKKIVNPFNLSVQMGSNYPNAIWEEFGTGAFAEQGNGRKGWWVYVKGGGLFSRLKSALGGSGGGKSYATEAEAKKACAYLRRKGLNAYYTQGKHARHHFYNAYESSKSKIIKHAEEVFGELNQ